MNVVQSFSQMTLHSPGMELDNITFHGSWTMMGNFSENTSRMSRLPPAFYICWEDFKPLGIRAHLFSAVCFVLVYAIPGKPSVINGELHFNIHLRLVPFSLYGKDKD